MKHPSSLRLHDCAVLFAAPDGFPWSATSANLPVTLSGPGRILSKGNGDSLCHEPDQRVITATSEELKSSTLKDSALG